MPAFIQEYSVAELKFSELQIEKNFKYDLRAKWETHKPKLSTLTDSILEDKIVVALFDDKDENSAALFWQGEVLTLIDLEKKTLTLSITGNSKTECEKILGKIKEIYEPEPDATGGKVRVRFWYVTNAGPRSIFRTISVPDWKQIEDNYDEKTLRDLKFLVNDFKPSSGGQLIIMSGLPGTGKSYYLRALLHAWKDWCTAEYVLDPENLFGGSQGYMANVVLQNSYDEEDDYVGDEQDEAGKWKLLILEDSGELLVPDAKHHVGQALSRLLNLVDGLIGQGLRVLVLITTNEEFVKLHPAVSRDGRCAAAIEFNPLTREKAEKWMNGSAPRLPEGKTHFTLAELYALSMGTTVKKLAKESTNFGFQMR